MKHFFKSAFLITALFTATPTYSAETQKLYLYTWSNFLDQKLFDKFTAETGIQIIAESMDSNEAAMAKLQTGASYDIVSASSY